MRAMNIPAPAALMMIMIVVLCTGNSPGMAAGRLVLALQAHCQSLICLVPSSTSKKYMPLINVPKIVQYQIWSAGSRIRQLSQIRHSSLRLSSS